MTAGSQPSLGQAGQDWICFGRVCQAVHFRNPLLKLSLCSFLPFENWFRFTFFGSWFGVLDGVL